MVSNNRNEMTGIEKRMQNIRKNMSVISDKEVFYNSMNYRNGYDFSQSYEAKLLHK